MPAIESETELYAPVKQFLERRGYTVKAEVRHCDIVAVREGSRPVIVELKKTLNIPLLVQGIERLRHTDQVYIAFAKNPSGKAPHGVTWSDLSMLCRKLGLGLLTVRFYKRKPPAVEVLCEPASSDARRASKATTRLLTEFHERSGDYNIGGSTRRKLVTAYREKALQAARELQRNGPLSTRALREITGNARIAVMLRDNPYRWFRRVSHGVYELTPLGETEIADYAHIPDERQ